MFRQIKYFQAVVRCGSFTKAAEECFLSQSAVSQQVQALERALGVELLRREKRSFTLTPAGEHFYERSLLLTAEFDALCQETVRIARRDEALLRIGYLRCYGGQEFRLAVGAFSAQYPEVPVRIINGNHEDLYDALRTGGVDLILSDQRRAFSDEYVNLILTTCDCWVELPVRHPLAAQARLEVSDLHSLPCILIASREQQENEQTYYRTVVGLSGPFLFAGHLEEARMLVAGGQGFLPIEGRRYGAEADSSICRRPLLRRGMPIRRTYCAFWRADNAGAYVEAFAVLLRQQFEP